VNLTEMYLRNNRSEIWHRKTRLRNKIRTDSVELGMSDIGMSIYYGIHPGSFYDLCACKIDDERELYKYENIIFGE
jgi:hypothetical protein